MSDPARRARRILAALCLGLVAASSAGAAFTLRPPPDLEPWREQLTTGGGSEPRSPDYRPVEALVDSFEDDTALAPRAGETRSPGDARAPACPHAPSRLALPAGPGEGRLADHSRDSELARWCLAHATSTQAT